MYNILHKEASCCDCLFGCFSVEDVRRQWRVVVVVAVEVCSGIGSGGGGIPELSFSFFALRTVTVSSTAKRYCKQLAVAAATRRCKAPTYYCG